MAGLLSTLSMLEIGVQERDDPGGESRRRGGESLRGFLHVCVKKQDRFGTARNPVW